MLGTTRCPVVAGWQDRLRDKAVLAGISGLSVGTVAAIAKGHPVVRFAAQSTLSFVLLGTLYGGVQEACRLVRCHDSPVNSAFAGAAAGSLIHRANGRHPLHGALAYGAIATAAHAASAAWRPDETLRDVLRAQRDSELAAREAREAETGPGWLRRLGDAIGMRRMSEAEWAEYTAAQDEKQRQRVQAALEGKTSQPRRGGVFD
ncbi:hypothetical protein F751_5473 [Auxenochlorella protothecoides]|uniref:Uncharacterized protein n=1 Tax=Auxenochlorella protothecoides TaxID=3075 RepID=A0A087STR3_AUXPR|nr:hypothetical protein F751_5473 [Auxenochlorella protothecoides]KFM29117.1 hypothetical protein F751_5473 [Auxenochlorella protothecoides]